MAVTGHYMTDRVRQALAYIEAFRECSLSNILPAFGDIENKAEEVADAEFRRLGSLPVNDDNDVDMADLAEQAEDKAQAFYQTMSSLRQAVLNLLAAGLFHLIEQQLADLCRDGAFTVPAPKDAGLDVVRDWYREHFGLDLETLGAWPKIGELRLLANAVKHAEGRSAQRLRRVRPELFQPPMLAEVEPALLTPVEPVLAPLAGDDIYVTEQLFEEYSEAARQLFADLSRHFETHGDEYYPWGN